LKIRKTAPAVLLADKAAHWAITFGGLSVIAAVLGIFVFILLTVLPLFIHPQAKMAARLPAIAGMGDLRLALLDEHREKAILVRQDGSTSTYDFASQTSLSGPALVLGAATGVSAALGDYHSFAVLGLSDGRMALADAGFDTRFDGDVRVKIPYLKDSGLLPMDAKRRPLSLVRVGGREGQAVLAAQSGLQDFVFNVANFDGKIWKGKPLAAEVPATEGAISALLVHSNGERVLIGTQKGRLLDYRVADGKLKLYEALDGLKDEAISALAYTIGEQSVVVGGAKGSVRSFTLLEKGERNEYALAHEFQNLGQGVESFSVSLRDRTFVARGSQSLLRAYFLTADRTLFDVQLPEGIQAVALRLAPKGDGLLAVAANGQGLLYGVRNPHPEVTLKTLFGKVWYEGYEKPDYVWQSTGGSDDFEAKFSLTPLIYGTIKGTFYALLFAMPLAIFGAIYTSQFMSRNLRAIVKPVVEIMAALPSVVLGFLAALLLAPMIEKNIFSIFLGILGLPAFAVLSLLVWRALPSSFTKRVPEEAEIGVLLVGLGVGFGVVALAGPGIERALFYDFKVWLANQLHVNYDQRNSLVVGFAMGFAVIPIIFTICEDALSSVPKHLLSASLSAGATPWQTAILVVLPVALSGIFSAVMVGFGRAVGETMIVLMATGNTAVMEFSPFNGFRALSANIAVEIPEAPVDGTLYRVLFFAGLLLFLVTFVVNTVAELVRLHLRKKYSQL
jgi:phosphate transport system permease protein